MARRTSTAESLAARLYEADDVTRRVMLVDIAERYGRNFADRLLDEIESSKLIKANERAIGRRHR